MRVRPDGRCGWPEAIHAMSHAYRHWALRHPARYQASNLMPAPGDAEVAAESLAAIQIIADVLTAYELKGDDAIDAIRAFRSSLHGFVSLEAEGGFALSADVERSFERLVQGFIVALSQWAGQPARKGQDSSQAFRSTSARARSAGAFRHRRHDDGHHLDP
jgi:hypothetical protein